MRHAKVHKTMHGSKSHQKARRRNMITALLKYGRIETTETKAKDLKPLADKMITLGKRGDLHARRQALAVIQEKEVVKKLFGELAEKYRDRPGGYTRIIRTHTRHGDGAKMAILELVSEELTTTSRKKKPKPEESRAKTPPPQSAEGMTSPSESADQPAAAEGEAESQDQKTTGEDAE